MSNDIFRIGRLAPGLHLGVTEDAIRAAMNEERLTQALADNPPRAWRFIESDSDELPVYLYWEGICVEAPRRPRAWIVALLARLEKSREGHGGERGE